MDELYRFEAGQPARASEVNANFETIYNQAKDNYSELLNIKTIKIIELENNKANKNGNRNNTFQVRDPVVSNDAVNKQYFENRTSNSTTLISGLSISVDTGSDNTIIVRKGSCIDSTGEVLLKLTEDISKINSVQVSDGLYYVYIISTDNGRTADIEISGENYTGKSYLYRQIGKYRADSTNRIVNPISYGTDDNCNELFKIAPDWERGTVAIAVSTTESWVAPCSGWICVSATNTTWRVDDKVPYNLLSFISGGSTITGTSSTVANLLFIPCVGV